VEKREGRFSQAKNNTDARRDAARAGVKRISRPHEWQSVKTPTHCFQPPRCRSLSLSLSLSRMTAIYLWAPLGWLSPLDPHTQHDMATRWIKTTSILRTTTTTSCSHTDDRFYLCWNWIFLVHIHVNWHLAEGCLYSTAAPEHNISDGQTQIAIRSKSRRFR